MDSLVTPASLAQLFNTALVFGALALAFRDLARRPWVHFRLNRRAARALAPAWCLLGAASVLAALLFPAGQPGYWRLLYQWAVLPAGTLLMAMLFLEAGSVWAWRAGLRGRGFGWLRPWRRWREILPLRPLLLGVAAANGLTIAVFLGVGALVPIRLDPSFQASQQPFEHAGDALLVLVVAQLIIAPFFEEALYRHYLQSRLVCWFEARGVSWRWAAVLASAAWALGHAGLLVPGWAKFLQIFAAGLLLGWVQRRWGVALAIAVHLSLNVGVFLYAPLLAPR